MKTQKKKSSGDGAPKLKILEAKNPPQIPKTTPKTPRLHELFRKIRANFCLLPCDTSQEPNGNCSEKLVQTNLFYFGWFLGVDFPFQVPEGHHPRGTTVREALRGNLPLRARVLRGPCGFSSRVLRGLRGAL